MIIRWSEQLTLIKFHLYNFYFTKPDQNTAFDQSVLMSPVQTHAHLSPPRTFLTNMIAAECCSSLYLGF